jgi:hypothetical protein
MIELILLLYIVPKRIYPLAKQQGKSGLGWTVLGGVAFLGGELFLGFTVGVIYAIASVAMGGEIEMSGSVRLLLYIPSVICGIFCFGLVERYLRRQSMVRHQPLPPAPPTFT